MGTLILNPKNLVVMCSWKNSKPFLSLVQPEWLTMVIHSVQLCVMAGLLLRQVSRLKIFTCFPWRQQKAEELKTSSKCIMTFYFINEMDMIMHSSQIHQPNSKLNKNKSMPALCLGDWLAVNNLKHVCWLTEPQNSQYHFSGLIGLKSLNSLFDGQQVGWSYCIS